MKRLLLPAVLSLLPLSAVAGLVPQPPDVEARSYVVVDFQSGQILAERDAHMRSEPASITKVMTDYIAFDELKKGNIKIDDPVLISEKAWRTEGSRTFVEVGQRVRLEDLIRGSIIQSGNDATVAIAEHIAGDESVFVQLMNNHAQRLGMKNTRYSNATGLPHPDLYTTAYDIALLSQALIRDFPDRYPIFSEREFTFGHRGEIRQGNRNLLLDLDPSADGIKTGHTESAGYCLAASSIRDGRRLIAVVMGTAGMRERAQAAKALLDYGFRFFETTQLFGPQRPVQNTRVWKGSVSELPVGTLEPVAFSLPRGAGASLRSQVQLDPLLVAPIARGQAVGTLTVSVEGKTLRTLPLVALQDVPAGSWWRRLIDSLRLWFA
ncbi:MAG TPA: D-alanyl-D-alanine carboxypeptidase family protein [Solimonas sp.]|nr:D-alanyl-D-alanine carboxypeptidase family protein [Solimonas sp.]